MKHKRGLNPILYDILWKATIFLLMFAFGVFCVWVAGQLSAMGW